MIAKYLPKILFFTVLAGFLYIVMILFYGMPLHDFNLWRLEGLYVNAEEHHPYDSKFLMKKKYLGGPDEHGSQECNYVVGEVRSSDLVKDEIKSIYSGSSVSSISGFYRIPIKTLFIDEDNWPVEAPWWDWEDELKNKFNEATSTVYLVYIAVEGYPFLLDYRCDD